MSRVLKQLLSIILFLFVLSMTGCSTQRQDEAVSDSSNTKTEGTENETNNTTEKNVEIESLYRFSEDRAWIKTTGKSGKKNEYVCIDKNGNVLFSVNSSNILQALPFSNGYSFLETNNALYQIDLKGNLVNTYQSSDNINFKAYDEGHVWIEEYTSDFDEARFTYTLYNPSGNKVTEFSIEGTDPIDKIYYYGKGMWGYSTYDENGDSIQMFYSTQKDKWIETPIVNSNFIYFYEDSAVIGITSEDPDETGYRAKMNILDINGSLTEIGISADLGWNWDGENYINEGYCILEEFENYLVSYDISTGEFKTMDNEYSKSLKTDSLPEKLMFTNGAVALPLTGKDNETYVGLFDTSWNIIGEPIPCLKFDYSDGRLLLVQEIQKEGENGTSREFSVYDSKGNLVFSSDEKGYYAITSFQDEVACVLSDDYINSITVTAYFDHYLNLITPNNVPKTDPLVAECKYIDKEGNYLFDNINAKNAKEILLE